MALQAMWISLYENLQEPVWKMFYRNTFTRRNYSDNPHAQYNHYSSQPVFKHLCFYTNHTRSINCFNSFHNSSNYNTFNYTNPQNPFNNISNYNHFNYANDHNFN
ncbi:hypothetical protein EYF80_060197 [Liparis tanakae]|uniref:Uncharacterized protein n=1 Tax=Liparis tanakae TaxID=230148 RepID=A0A4Z2EMH0_9TELE|nr:hypothetical protein EYF80_060197 [Liparis tanakae]